MIRKLGTLTGLISVFASKTAFAAGKEETISSYIINVDAIGAVLLAVLAVTIYIRVQDEKVKQYEKIRNKR